jgi:hypothetical protein
VRKISTIASASLLVVAAGVGIAACGGISTIATSTTSTTATSSFDPSAVPRPTGPLSAPKVSVVDEENYLRDATEADPALATYVNDDGSVALKALLTDGSAFCAFLARGGGIDDAMVSLAIGARGVETTTHLPSTVATFNAIEATALLTLCPSEQDLVPAADRKNIRALGEALAGTSG